MKRLLLALCLVAASVPTLSYAHSLTGKIVNVINGEYVVVRDAQRKSHLIRMAGIDTPVQGQPYYKAAKENLTKLALNRSASVDWDKYDDYCERAKIPDKKCWKIGRIIVDGNDLNLEQVKQGLAWHSKFRMGEQTTGDRTAYEEAQAAAQKKKLGLWKQANPVPPWEYERKPASLHKASKKKKTKS